MSPVTVKVDVKWYRNYCRYPSSCVIASASTWTVANVTRDDLPATVSSSYGSNHGFFTWVPDGPVLFQYDWKTVCVTALNSGFGSNTSLGCYQIL